MDNGIGRRVNFTGERVLFLFLFFFLVGWVFGNLSSLFFLASCTFRAHVKPDIVGWEIYLPWKKDQLG